MGPHANLPRTSTTRTKITTVHSALPTSPAKGLRAVSCSCAETTAGITVRAKAVMAENRGCMGPSWADRAGVRISGSRQLGLLQHRQQPDDHGEQRRAFD